MFNTEDTIAYLLLSNQGLNSEIDIYKVQDILEGLGLRYDMNNDIFTSNNGTTLHLEEAVNFLNEKCGFSVINETDSGDLVNNENLSREVKKKDLNVILDKEISNPRVKNIKKSRLDLLDNTINLPTTTINEELIDKHDGHQNDNWKKSESWLNIDLNEIKKWEENFELRGPARIYISRYISDTKGKKIKIIRGSIKEKILRSYLSEDSDWGTELIASKVIDIINKTITPTIRTRIEVTKYEKDFFERNVINRIKKIFKDKEIKYISEIDQIIRENYLIQPAQKYLNIRLSSMKKEAINKFIPLREHEVKALEDYAISRKLRYSPEDFKEIYDNLKLTYRLFQETNIELPSFWDEIEESEDPDFWNNKGIDNNKSGKFEDAIQNFDKAIELNPEDDDYWYNRGNAKFLLEDDVGAIKDFTKSLELNPNNENVWNERGVAKHYSKGYVGAIEDFTKSLELNPNNENVWSNRGNTRYNLEDYVGAIEDLTKSLEFNLNNDNDWNVRGIAKYQLEDYLGAIEDFTKSLELNPNNANVWNLRGNAKDKLGDHISAIDDYIKVSELKPDDTVFFKYLENYKSKLEEQASTIED
ncbi:tetratricopeptide repeat protein [archaeon]|jgi:tetratricopeptide (TPR) repeat protein|nr:tetratricopeptide repeat protein [archaeon]MBT3450586.1 tetratricopeptide repeat protein [archaeon]MBT6868440.1 tetratricopeptide repeat protein [archaeon]MBT7193539.1 tetratricopeptide repeat protein [archaeon]MBT7381266.1 tetratricopeptide repeat protein [archaeon]